MSSTWDIRKPKLDTIQFKTSPFWPEQVWALSSWKSRSVVEMPSRWSPEGCSLRMRRHSETLLLIWLKNRLSFTILLARVMLMYFFEKSPKSVAEAECLKTFSSSRTMLSVVSRLPLIKSSPLSSAKMTFKIVSKKSSRIREIWRFP